MITPADIVRETESWLGTRYCHRASLKGAGCDCLGLVRGVWRALYGEEPEPLPPYTPDWAARTGRNTLIEGAVRNLVERSVSDAGPGDVLVFRLQDKLPPGHLGILCSDNRFIHARSGQGVIRAPRGRWWRERTVAAFSFPTEKP